MCDFEFDPKDIERIRRFRDRFDRYCKKTIYNAAHNLVLMQTQFLILQYGADDMRNFKPLNDEEQKIIQRAQRILGNSATIPCTACHYCVEGCPKQIKIPDIFSAMNKQLGNGQKEEAYTAYENVAEEGHRASDCIECKQCERACPQHLPITDYLKQGTSMFE